MRPAKNVLLTGAGFTKDFGGYLGGEMWAAILSQQEISTYPNLRQKLLAQPDYEQAYHEVLDSESYSDKEKLALRTAVETAYQRMHRRVMTVGTDSYDLIKPLLRGIVLRFAGAKEERGFIFTLNQDLFLEGSYRNNDPSFSGHHLSTPGTTPPRGGFMGTLHPSLADGDWVTLPDEAQLEPMRSSFLNSDSQSKFVYIKLYGSYGWRSADGTHAMVVGGGKEERIAKEPLIKWYLDLFREVLTGPECNLLVIGYGFRDKLINDVIAHAIRDQKLRLYIISPHQPVHLSMQLDPVLGLFPPAARPTEAGQTIWEGLHRYYVGKISDLIDKRAPSFLTLDGQAFFGD